MLAASTGKNTSTTQHTSPACLTHFRAIGGMYRDSSGVARADLALAHGPLTSIAAVSSSTAQGNIQFGNGELAAGNSTATAQLAGAIASATSYSSAVRGRQAYYLLSSTAQQLSPSQFWKGLALGSAFGASQQTAQTPGCRYELLGCIGGVYKHVGSWSEATGEVLPIDGYRIERSSSGVSPWILAYEAIFGNCINWPGDTWLRVKAESVYGDSSYCTVYVPVGGSCNQNPW